MLPSAGIDEFAATLPGLLAERDHVPSPAEILRQIGQQLAPLDPGSDGGADATLAANIERS